MWELDCEEGWAPKNWCFWTVVLEKTLESPLDCKEMHPVRPKGNQSRIFIGRTDAEAETPILWSPDAKSWLIWKDSDAGNDWGQEEKGMTEDEMVGWHHRLNGHGFGWTLGVGDGQGGLACCGPWDHKESDTTERLNWTDDKPTANIITIMKSWKGSHWNLEQNKDAHCHLLYSTQKTGRRNYSNNKRKRKGTQTGREEVKVTICTWYATVYWKP